MNRPMTGRDAALLLVAFFAVIIAVNVTMARLAGSTFGGKLAENGYVASRDYARWRAQAEAQERLGWTVSTGTEGGRLVIRTGGVKGAAITVRALHPLGREADRAVAMRPLAGDVFESVSRLPPGRWRLDITLAQGGREARFRSEVRG